MCVCGAERYLHMMAKHDDRCVMSISTPDVDYEKEGYALRIGPFGGDDFNMAVCLECGRIQAWKPVTDEDITELIE